MSDGDAEATRDAKIAKLLAPLSTLERELVKLRYGLGDGQSYTVHEVAAVLKKSTETIQEMEFKALQKLTVAATEKLARQLRKR